MQKKQAGSPHKKELTRLAGIVSTSHEAIYSINLDGAVVTWNHGAEMLFGYKAQEIIGKKLRDITIPDNRVNEFHKVIKLIKQKRDIPAFETIRKKKNGTLIHVLFSVSYLTNEHGGVNGASVIARDVSEQRQTIRELEQANTILYNIIQNTIDAIYVKDLEGNYLMANNAVSNLLHTTTLELLGKNDFSLLSKNDAEEIRKHDLTVIKSKKPMQLEEQVTIKKRTQTFLSTKVPYFDANHKVMGVIGISKDITETKEKEQAREDMLAIVSHELRNPLTSISLYSHELEKNLHSPKNKIYATKIFSQTKRINGFIHELLDLARIESRTLDLRLETFHLPEVLDELIESIQIEYPTHTIEINGSYDFKLYADRIRFSQIVTNLLTNAIKYSPNATKVQLMITNSEDELLLQFKDFGIGIPKKHQAHIFDKYFRVKNKNTPGIGLGLHIVAQMVALHGGKIWVESKKNEGSIFYVSIPHQKKQK